MTTHTRTRNTRRNTTTNLGDIAKLQEAAKPQAPAMPPKRTQEARASRPSNLKPLSEIISALPAFTAGQMWQRLATSFGWKMMAAALRICEAEDKEAEAKRKADIALKTEGGNSGANVDDMGIDMARAIATAEKVAVDPYSTGQQRLSPHETLIEFEDIRGATAIRAIMAYKDAPVKFSTILDRASASLEAPKKQLDAFIALMDDPDMPEEVAKKVLDDYTAAQAARYIRHREGILMYLKTVNGVDADFDEAFDAAHEEVRTFTVLKLHEALSKRLALIDLHNTEAPEWVQRTPPLARLQEIKLLRGAIRDLDSLHTYYARQATKLAL